VEAAKLVHQQAVNAWRGCKDVAREVREDSIRASHDPTRFAYEQRAGSDVPRCKAGCEECVEAACSHTGEVKRGAPQPTNASDFCMMRPRASR
jgi:hypothetical protein